jgi:hypothetical protein
MSDALIVSGRIETPVGNNPDGKIEHRGGKRAGAGRKRSGCASDLREFGFRLLRS